jgi:hypothetical protein
MDVRAYTPFRTAVCLACLVESPAQAAQRFGSATDHSIATSLGPWCAIATRPSVIFSKTRKRTDAEQHRITSQGGESLSLLGDKAITDNARISNICRGPD